jgi:multidrug efflux pump subunit AcrB
VPLSLAVGFAMITSYLLSSTFVPVLSVWLLRHHTATHRGERGGGSPVAEVVRLQSQAAPLKSHDFSYPLTPPRSPRQAGWLARGFSGLLGITTHWRWLVVPVYLTSALVGAFFLGRLLGTEIFPTVDAGQFQFRLRAPTGTRIEQTEAMTREALEFLEKEVGPENVEITLGYIGVVPSSYPINSVYLWMGGPEESVMRVALKHGVVRVEEFKRRLREKLPAHLREWAAKKWIAEGEPAYQARRRLEDLRLSFEPADIINEVMSFGSPTPVEVVVSGPKMADNRAYAQKVHEQLRTVPSLRDLQYSQALDYPTVEVRIDREKAGVVGVTTEEVARSLVAATSSSRFVVPNYWRDPGSGIGYQVQVEIPQSLMRSSTDVETVPVKPNSSRPLLVRDVAEVKEGTMPGEIDRYNMRRVVGMTANIEGEDLGRVAGRISAALGAAGTLPAGVQVDVRGQVTPMREMFQGLAVGLAVAVVVIFLLLTAYFQSVRLSLSAVAAVPAVLCGVVLTLLLTGTTLNIQSFMGAIMAVGVAVANAILLVTFAERYRREGRSAVEAAIEGARTRLRPIAMTSLAMIAGMIPMALGLGEGGDQTAPLGRAVIGGLLASTVATLTLLPAVFALIMGRSSIASVSLSPTDPESSYYLPDFEEQGPAARSDHA